MQLSKDEDRTFASPAWSPDGQYVYVARSVPSYGLYEIWMYHVRGGSGVQITRSNDGAPGASTHMHAGADSETAVAVDVRPNAMGPAPSPDGKYLYYGLKLGGFEYNAEFPPWSVARRDLSSGAEDIFITSPGSAFDQSSRAMANNWCFLANRTGVWRKSCRARVCRSRHRSTKARLTVFGSDVDCRNQQPGV